MNACGCSPALTLLLAGESTVGAVLAAESAEEVLLDKANYWRLKDRPDLAAESLNKLLEINPNNPEALYQYGMLSVQDERISAPRTASRGSSTALTSMFSRRDISWAKASRCPGVGL